MSAEISNTFTHTCPCGETIHVIDGQEQPHDCRPIDPQRVLDAWAAGYEFGRNEAQRESGAVRDE